MATAQMAIKILPNKKKLLNLINKINRL